MPSGSPTAMKRPPARRGVGRAPDSAAAYGGTRGHTRLRGQLSPSGGAGTVDDPAFAESLSKKMWWPQRDSNPRLGLERARPCSDFTNLNGGCHGPVPLETAIR